MKKIFNLLVFIVLSLCLASCNSSLENQNSGDYSFYDDSSYEVKVAYKPSNVAMLFASFSDMWLNTGGTISIGVGDCINRGFCKEGSIKVVGDSAGKNIGLEDLVLSNPDFVIMQKDYADSNKLAQKLREYGIPCALFNQDTIDDYLHVLNIFAKINKNESAYEEYGTKVYNECKQIIASSKDNNSQNVLLLRATTTGKLSSLGHSNFVGAMLTDLNSINIADINSEILNDLSMEAILKYDPTKIFIVPMGDEEKAFKVAKEKLKEDVWSNISAIKNNEVYYLEKNLYHYKPNAEWSNAYLKLYKDLYE